ncbi:MAG: hypothetical protein KC589_06590 [Nanoarchaeota archaeon]|nr:hypothetical protein [Nanoarchaeota archaeon]
MIQFKEYLTEIKQNELYKEFLKVQKNPQQMELAFDFDDEIFTSNQEIARHILRQLNFISIGFEFEMYLKRKIKKLEPIILENITSDIYKTAHEYFIFDDYDLIDYKKHKEDLSKFIDTKYKDLNKFIYDNYLTFSFKPEYKDIGYFYDGKNLVMNLDNIKEYKKLASILRKKLKINCTVFDVYHKKNKNSIKNWYLEPDDSLGNAENEDYFPVEIVTKTYPAYKYKEVFNSLLKVLNDENYYPKTNKQTGLHFSISFDNKELNNNINLLKLIILGQDKFFLKKLGREFNSFCKSQYNIIISKIEKLTNEYSVLTKDVITHHNLIKELNRSVSYKKEKYTSINFSKYQIKSDNKFIEFRITGNDYLKEFKELSLRTIDWFLFIMVAASSKTLLEDEFYQKIEEISRQFVEK